MVFGMLLSIKHSFKVYGVQLKLMTASVNKALYKCANLFNAVLVSKQALVEFKSERTAIYSVLKMRL